MGDVTIRRRPGPSDASTTEAVTAIDATSATGATGATGPTASEPDNERLDAYLARSQTALDLLALSSLWIVLVPPSDFGSASTLAASARVLLSAIYGVDMAIRAWLSKHPLHYLRSHPLGLAAVAFPPVRVLFSVRLVTSVFRRGNLGRFLLAATVMVLNGAVIVLLYERDAQGSNIHTLGESLWWSATTVTTVGYGDYSPVTVAGRIIAVFIMIIGILTIAVITAQVAASFMNQASRKQAAQEPSTGSSIEERLERIELALASLARQQQSSPD